MNVAIPGKPGYVKTTTYIIVVKDRHAGTLVENWSSKLWALARAEEIVKSYFCIGVEQTACPEEWLYFQHIDNEGSYVRVEAVELNKKSI